MRATKDSGIEWIGQIPQEWDVRKIKHCFNVYAGATPKSGNSEFWDGDIVWVTPADYTTEQKYVNDGRKNITSEGFESCSTEMIPAGSLIFSKRAPIGLVAINTVDLCTNQGCLSCVPLDKNDVEYFYYAFSCFTEQFDLYGSGTTFKEISADAFVNFPIPYPGPETQRGISEYLRSRCSEIDPLIAAKEKTNALLKERRQSIIYEAVTKGLNPDAPMKDSGIEWIGEIPENWGIAALKRVATPSTGMTPSKTNSLYWEGDIPWFSSKDIKADYLFDSEDHISQQAVDECGLTVHDENSVVFCARSGILRHTFPVAVLKCKGTINQDLRVLATSAAIDPEFLMYYLRGMNNTIVTLYQKVGATVESIEMEWLLYLPVALPPVEVQKQIAEYIVARCNEIDGQIAANEVSVQKLKEYRQSVIYEAVTGKIEI